MAECLTITSSKRSWSSLSDETVDSYPDSDEDIIKQPERTNETASGFEEFKECIHSHHYGNMPFFTSRQMTYSQEMLNALTMLPAPIYCIYKAISGSWLSEQAIQLAKTEHENFFNHTYRNDINMISLLPSPMLAIIIGVCLHFPFSFYYHWKCAKHLPPGYERITHVTRRLDHAFIHVSSALFAYGTSGNLYYFLLSAIYNLDSAFKQFEDTVKPKRNHNRVAGSIVFFMIPVICFGNQPFISSMELICRMITWISIGAWFFIAYPIGGYSHAAFHLVLLVPLTKYLLIASSQLDVCMEKMGEAVVILQNLGKI